jgi:hypothetical protein
LKLRKRLVVYAKRLYDLLSSGSLQTDNGKLSCGGAGVVACLPLGTSSLKRQTHRTRSDGYHQRSQAVSPHIASGLRHHMLQNAPPHPFYPRAPSSTNKRRHRRQHSLQAPHCHSTSGTTQQYDVPLNARCLMTRVVRTLPYDHELAHAAPGAWQSGGPSGAEQGASKPSSLRRAGCRASYRRAGSCQGAEGGLTRKRSRAGRPGYDGGQSANRRQFPTSTSGARKRADTDNFLSYP